MKQFNMKTPLFFKFWFGFVFVCILVIWASVGYIFYAGIQAGPEGLGRAIGSVIKGINEGQK